MSITKSHWLGPIAKISMLLIVGLLMLAGCRLDDNRLRGSIRTGNPPDQPPPIAEPSDVILTSSFMELIKVETSSDPGLTTPAYAGDPVVANQIQPPLGGLSVPVGGMSATQGILTTLDSATPPIIEPLPQALDISDEGHSYSLTTSATLDPGTSWACEILNPFNSLPCSIGGLTLWASSLLTPVDGVSPLNLRVRVHPEDQAEPAGLSNSLPVHFFSIRQISNTAQDNSQDDNPMRFYVFENYLYLSIDIRVGLSNFSKLARYQTQANSLTQVVEISGSSSESPGPFLGVGSRLYFGAHFGTINKLYSYNPQTAAVTRHSDTGHSPGGKTDSVSGFASYNDKLYFRAENLNSNFVSPKYNKLFVFSPNPNPAAETLIQLTNTRNSHTADDRPMVLGVYNGKLFFFSNNPNGAAKLYSYHDASNTLTQVSNAQANNSLTDGCDSFFSPHHAFHQDRLYFSGMNSDGACKLFSYDDTSPSLVELSNTSGAADLTDLPQDYLSFGGRLFFRARNPSGVTKLYELSGNEIHLISNTSGSASDPDEPKPLVGHSNFLYFTSVNPQGSRKLFRYSLDNRTVEQLSNTRENESLTDFHQESAQAFAIYNERLYFWAYNPMGVSKIFSYNPITHHLYQIANTRQDQSLSDGNTTNTNGEFVIFNGQLMFSSRHPEGGTKLYALCDLEMGCEP